MSVRLEAFSVIKNGIELGYVFLESYRLVLDYVERLWIQDGYSEDGTFEWLQRLAYFGGERVMLTRYYWPRQVTGFAIGTATNRALEWAQNGEATHFLYVQADEIWHPRALAHVREVIAEHSDVDGFEFPFLHIQNNMQEPQAGAGYTHAIRLVRNSQAIRSHRDAWTFEGCQRVMRVDDLPVPIIHNNRSFWHNIPRKLRSHADNLYADLAHYAVSAEQAEELYGDGTRVPELFTRTDSPYRDVLPDILLPLLGKLAYEPREELLQ